MGDEKYTFTYEDTVTGTKVTRQFSATDLWELAHNILEFARLAGYGYVDMLEFSDPEGGRWRAENLD